MPETSRHFWNPTAIHATQNPFSSFRLRLGIIAAVLHSWPAANSYCNGRVGRRGRHKLCCAKANASCWPGFSLLSNLKNVKNIIKRKKKKKKRENRGVYVLGSVLSGLCGLREDLLSQSFAYVLSVWLVFPSIYLRGFPLSFCEIAKLPLVFT